MKGLGLIDGPDISDMSGKNYTAREIDDMLKDLLEDIYLEQPSLFPPQIFVQNLFMTITTASVLLEELPTLRL